MYIEIKCFVIMVFYFLIKRVLVSDVHFWEELGRNDTLEFQWSSRNDRNVSLFISVPGLVCVCQHLGKFGEALEMTEMFLYSYTCVPGLVYVCQHIGCIIIPRLWNREGDIEMALSVRPSVCPSVRPSFRHLRFLSN